MRREDQEEARNFALRPTFAKSKLHASIVCNTKVMRAFQVATAGIALAIMYMIGPSQEGICQQSEVPQFVRWASSQAVPVSSLELITDNSDLQALESFIGDNRIVALGESGHLIHEFLAFRNRLFKYLVEEQGFVAIAAETGVTEAFLVDDYVMGKSERRMEAARNAFTAGDVYEPNLELLDWIREYNNRPTTIHKVRFYGVDLPGQSWNRPGKWSARVSIDSTIAFLHRYGIGVDEPFMASLNSFLPKFSDKDFPLLSVAEKNAFTVDILNLISFLERERVNLITKSSRAEFIRAHRNAIAAQQVLICFATMEVSMEEAMDPENQEPPDGYNFLSSRDAAMADNLRWIMNEVGSEERIFVFAHNMHVKKGPTHKEAYAEWFPNKSPRMMGEHLRAMIGDEYLVIGHTFANSAEELSMPPIERESIDGLMAQVGLPNFVIDLHSAESENRIGEVIDRPMRFRYNDRYGMLNPMESYDAVVYTETVTPVKVID